MATVDREEDRVRRIITLHHRFHEQQCEWQGVVPRAFDDAREFHEFTWTGGRSNPVEADGLRGRH